MSGLHWIDLPGRARLAISGRPRAGDWLDDELASWQSAGVDVVVSLLEVSEVAELGLEREPDVCRRLGVEFRSFPMADRGVPESEQATAALVTEIVGHVSAGRGVAIHCRSGIGRSALIAACVAIALGVEAQAVLPLIARARGVDVPDTEEQKRWIRSFGLSR